MKRLVIFDCDGVLVDSERLSVDVLIDLLHEKNIEVKKEDISFFFKGAKLDLILKEIEKRYAVELPSIFDQEFREKERYYFENFLRPIDGIDIALSKISYPICIASSGPPEKIKSSLTRTGLDRYFSNNLFSSYQIDSWKPEPDIFLYAAKKMGFPPSNCVVVEDSPAGVQAARSAGMKVLGYCGDANSNELELHGAIPFSNMVDLPKLIEISFDN